MMRKEIKRQRRPIVCSYIQICPLPGRNGVGCALISDSALYQSAPGPGSIWGASISQPSAPCPSPYTRSLQEDCKHQVSSSQCFLFLSCPKSVSRRARFCTQSPFARRETHLRVKNTSRISISDRSEWLLCHSDFCHVIREHTLREKSIVYSCVVPYR